MPVSRRSAGSSAFHLSLKSAAVMALATARPRIARAADAARRAPQPHLAARDPHAIEQQLQMELGMAFFAAALIVGSERFPFLVWHHRSEAQRRQHDHAFGHVRHPPQGARQRPAQRW